MHRGADRQLERKRRPGATIALNQTNPAVMQLQHALNNQQPKAPAAMRPTRAERPLE